MACSNPNIFAFIGAHWFVALIFAVIIGKYVLQPLSVFVLAVAWRVMGR